jgi:hypothetical protein
MSEMQKYINDSGKEAYSGVTVETPFSKELFHRVRMPEHDGLYSDNQWALHTNLGSLTVLDRMTGFGYRDVETGYRDMAGKFWLASGDFDVRYSGALTLGEAIQWVKTRANNCNPDRDEAVQETP